MGDDPDEKHVNSTAENRQGAAREAWSVDAGLPAVMVKSRERSKGPSKGNHGVV